MQIIPLREVSAKVFRKQNLAELYRLGVEISIKDWLTKPNNFMLAAKSCDGSFHSVSSEITRILSEKHEDIRRGQIKDAILELAPQDPIHGDRFVVYIEGKNSFLLGTIEEAMMTLAESNIKF